MDIEHRITVICNAITDIGVPFDRAAGEDLLARWNARRGVPQAQLAQQFPGTNLNSRPQIGKLLEDRGWIPEKRTEKTNQPKINDELLETIHEIYPEFAGLSEYMVLGRRIGQLSKGQKAWPKQISDDGRIHGGLVPIGTPHSRAKHLDPNLAQVPNHKKGKPFAAECRALFRSNNGWVMVAADQASLQDRGLAHYLHPYDNGGYAQAFLAGEDTHWKTTTALGLIDEGTARDKESKLHTSMRESGKRFRYAFLYGAQAATAGRVILDAARTALVIDPTSTFLQRLFESSRPAEATIKRIGGAARRKFEAAVPGLVQLRQLMPAPLSTTSPSAALTASRRRRDSDDSVTTSVITNHSARQGASAPKTVRTTRPRRWRAH
jgi:DNA polymerase I-like protein with 3'-5' exonuclease and polymerase domains